MVAEMTGPNECFQPGGLQQKRQTEYQPLLEQGGTRQPSHSSDRGEQECPAIAVAIVPSSPLSKAAGKAPKCRELWDTALESAPPPEYKYDNDTAAYKSADLVVEGPSDVHPALRADEQAMNKKSKA